MRLYPALLSVAHPRRLGCCHAIRHSKKMLDTLQVVSSLLAGAAIGSLSGSTLADRLGRKNAFLANAAPLLLGALLSATASSLVPMVAGRAIAGFGIGLASALVPLYISEVTGHQGITSSPPLPASLLSSLHGANPLTPA